MIYRLMDQRSEKTTTVRLSGELIARLRDVPVGAAVESQTVDVTVAMNVAVAVTATSRFKNQTAPRAIVLSGPFFIPAITRQREVRWPS